MAEDIQELTVRIRPEGIDETTEQLEEQGEQFEETAEIAGEQADELEEFSERWDGAMNVFVAGLGIATAGILSKVPVLSTVAAGINAVMTALGLKISEFIGGPASGLANWLFQLANWILETEGPISDLIGLIGVGLVTVVGALIGKLTAATTGISAFALGFKALAAVAAVIKGAILAIVGAVGGPLLAIIAIAIAIVAGLYLAWKNNWFNIRDITANIISTIGGLLDGLVQWFIQTGGNILDVMIRALNSVLTRVDIFVATIRTAFEVMGEAVVASLKMMANRAVAAIETAINTAIGAIPKEIRAQLGLGQVSIGRPFDPQSLESIGRRGRQRLGRRRTRVRQRGGEDVSEQVAQLVAALQNNTQRTSLEVDGQTLAENVQNFLGEDALNRGRGS